MPPRRSTPKILHRAGELRHRTTPAEKKLWAYLRLMHEDGLRFRRQHAIEHLLQTFVRRAEKSSLNWMEVNTWSRKVTIKKEQTI